MTLGLIAGGLAVYLAVSATVALLLGRAIRIADREQTAQRRPVLRLVS